MYNHPYFGHPYYLSIVEHSAECCKTEPTTNTGSVMCNAPVPNNFKPDQRAMNEYQVNHTIFRDDASPFGFRPNYRPDVIIPDHTVWENNNDAFMECIANEFRYYNPANGYKVDVDSRITVGQSKYARGMLMANAMQSAEEIDGIPQFNMAPVIIVNTENAGLRYVRKDPDSDLMYDIGPVNDACIIGNYTRPEGIYVPFSNARAMADAAIMLGNELKCFQGVASVTEAIENTLVERHTPSAPFEAEVHECECGGNCKCHHD